MAESETTHGRPIWWPWHLLDWLFLAFVVLSGVAIGISVGIIND